MANEARSPLPDDVAALARREQMGGYVRTFHPRRGRPSGTIAVLVMLNVILLGLGLWALAVGLTSIGIGIFVLDTVALIIIIAANPAVNPRIAARKVYLFEQGFIPAKASGPVGHFRWDTIASVLQRIADHYYEGVYTGRIFRYTVTRNDGVKVKLTQFYDDIEEFGHVLTAELTRVHLPRAMASIQEGRPVYFGSLSVDAYGLAEGRRWLPWTELKDLKIQRGNVVVHKTSGFATWSSKPAWSIPNLHVFLALVDRLSPAQRP